MAHFTSRAVRAPVEDARVTVVAMSRNRRAELLESLPRHRAPTILVDNGSSDGTAEAVRAELPDVEVLALDRNEGARARTIGVAHAGTPFVAFADDDSWWAPGALHAAAQVLSEHPDVAVVCARILVGPEERTDAISAQMAHSPLPRPPGLRLPRVLGFVACAAMVRVSAFEEVGGFDAVVRFPGEEERVALDLAARGWSLVYADDVVVHHHPSPRREDAAARTRGVTRSRLLTAVLRLPWRHVLRRSREALTGGPATRAGLGAALRDVPAALRSRRRLPRPVLDDLAVLRDREGRSPPRP